MLVIKSLILPFIFFIYILNINALETKDSNNSINNGAVSLVYHRFGESKYPSTNITLKQFQTQLDFLEDNNYNVWSLSKIVDAIKSKKTIPPKTVSITMDDAYYSVYENAYPMLKEKSFAFTVFVNTDPIDKKLKSYVTWDQMREMQENKGEFFNHSFSHDYLLKKENESKEDSFKRITNEILKAQKRLDDELGKKEINLLSYPYGEYDLKTKKIVEDLGIIGISQTSGPIGKYSDLQAITRFPISEKFSSIKAFEIKLNTVQLPIKAVSINTPVFGKNNPPLLRIELEKSISRISCFLSSGEKIDIKWIDKKSFEIKSPKPLEGEREKYTCTAPFQNGKWYWYSQLFIVERR